MPRPRKYPQSQVANPNGNGLNYSENDGIVQTVIEEQKEGGMDLLTLANQSLNASGDTAPAYGKNHNKNRAYKDNLKARKSGQSEEISTIITTVLTLIVSAWSIPINLKPNEEEVNGFSVPVTRLILRHVPIVSKLSQDALDIIGLLGVISAYYVRTGDDWKSYREARQAAKEQRINEPVEIIPSRPVDDPLDMLLRRGPLDVPINEGLPT